MQRTIPALWQKALAANRTAPAYLAEEKDGWREVRPNWEGLLMAPVEAGQPVLQLRFDVWTPARIAGCALSLLTALGLLVLVRRE